MLARDADVLVFFSSIGIQLGVITTDPYPDIAGNIGQEIRKEQSTQVPGPFQTQFAGFGIADTSDAGGLDKLGRQPESGKHFDVMVEKGHDDVTQQVSL